MRKEMPRYSSDDQLEGHDLKAKPGYEILELTTTRQWGCLFSPHPQIQSSFLFAPKMPQTTEIRLHNTLSNQTEPFVPQKSGEVTMYTCGPTVYDFAHIGNYRTFVFQDILRRFLKLRGCVSTKIGGGVPDQIAIPPLVAGANLVSGANVALLGQGATSGH